MQTKISRYRPAATTLFAAALVLYGISARAAPPRQGAQSAALAGVIADYDAYCDVTDPVDAGQRGNLAQASRWPDHAPAAVVLYLRTLENLQRRLKQIPRGSLSGEAALNDDMLAWRLAMEIESWRFDEERIPFTADEGFYANPAYAAEGTVIRTEADAGAWLARMRALPAYYAIETANMQRGIRTGWVQPRLIAMKAAGATASQAALAAGQSPLLEPFAALPANFPPARQAALRKQALDIVRDQVKPAEVALAGFFRDVYVPASRASLGASSMPGGRAYYAYRVRHETTLDLTPDQVFAIGQSEIARIRKAMDVQIKATGFTGDFKSFQEKLRTDPQFYVASREALLEKASRLAKLVDDQLPRFIGKLPRLTYGVRQVPLAIEENYTTGRYDPGSPEQGIAGGLMINTSHLDQRPLYELPVLVAHEGVPGHHIQIALGQEMTDLPSFRRKYDITAFVEGWALYSEQLVSEMGLYPTPYDRFGMLSMEMWRACRLVMDVGIHWKGWSRDQALSCLRENTALADKNIQNETDRYIAWPGQALGYKIGEMKIVQLRLRAQAALGPRFDYRSFHDEVLDEGAMPLSLLEPRVDGWIAAQKHAGHGMPPRAAPGR